MKPPPLRNFSENSSVFEVRGIPYLVDDDKRPTPWHWCKGKKVRMRENQRTFMSQFICRSAKAGPEIHSMKTIDLGI